MVLLTLGCTMLLALCCMILLAVTAAVCVRDHAAMHVVYAVQLSNVCTKKWLAARS